MEWNYYESVVELHQSSIIMGNNSPAVVNLKWCRIAWFVGGHNVALPSGTALLDEDNIEQRMF